MFAFNALIGGAVATTRAFFGDRDPAKAFALGTIGGTVHFAGKLVASRTPSLGIAGVAISSTGTSIVANAARGVRLLEELTLPIGFARVRAAPYNRWRVRVAMNAYEAFVAAGAFRQRGLRFDARRSATSGVLVFMTDRHRIEFDGQPAHGVANGSVIAISAFAEDRERTARHELAHVQQHWFAQELLDRPAQAYLRNKVSFARRLIPEWLELGIATPALRSLDWAIAGRRGPVHQLVEHEAEILARR